MQLFVSAMHGPANLLGGMLIGAVCGFLLVLYSRHCCGLGSKEGYASLSQSSLGGRGRRRTPSTGRLNEDEAHLNTNRGDHELEDATGAGQQGGDVESGDQHQQSEQSACIFK